MLVCLSLTVHRLVYEIQEIHSFGPSLKFCVRYASLLIRLLMMLLFTQISEGAHESSLSISSYSKKCWRGQILGSGKRLADPETVKAIHEMKTPRQKAN